MPLNRFFIDRNSFDGNKIFISNPEQIHQIKNVLRFKIGDQIIVLDNTGFEYSVSLGKIDPREIEGQIIKKQKNKNEPKIEITLLQALLKHDKFEQVLKFGTSLGINCFRPIVTSRSVIREISQNKIIRWQKIIKEAAEQSGRGIIPTLENLLVFKEVMNSLANKNIPKLIAWEQEKKTKLFSLKKRIKKAREIYLCLGPEGGFTLEEILLAQKSGFQPFSLGKLILRAEIAGVVASSLIFGYNKTI